MMTFIVEWWPVLTVVLITLVGVIGELLIGSAGGGSVDRVELF